MGKSSFALLIVSFPKLHDDTLNSAHRFMLRNASVCHSIKMILEKLHFILGCQMTILRNPAVMIMSDQIVDILLEIRSSTTDRMNLILSDHFCQREPQFCRAHCSSQRDQHPATISDMLSISERSVFNHGGIEMPIMMINKFRNRSFSHAGVFTPSRWKLDKTIPQFFYFFCYEDADQRNDLKLKTSTSHDGQTKRSKTAQA